MIRGLNLQRYGLEMEEGPPSIFTPQEKGRGLLLHHNPLRAAEEIQQHSARDAERYVLFRAFIERVGKVINRLIDEVPPNLIYRANGDLPALLKRAVALRRLGRTDLIDLIRLAPMSVADWLDEWFESDILKAALAGPAMHGAFIGPRSPGGAFNLLLRECRRSPSVKGGPGFLVTALEGAARALGVDIHTNAAVEQIRVAGGAVKGVRIAGGDEIDAPLVAASCDPKRTFLDLIESNHVSDVLARRIQNFRTMGTAAKVDVALNARIELAGRPGEKVEFVRTGARLDDIERAFDAIKYGKWSERPILDVYMPTYSNAGFAPEGHTVLSMLVHYVPYRVKQGWNFNTRDAVGDAALHALEVYAPAIRKAVVGMRVLTPQDLEDTFGLSDGHIFHGEHAIDQLLVRPTPECARYATPINGLFLCGSGSHPGGGITCAPGALAAKLILKTT